MSSCKIGGTAEVTWSIRNNHGGGYQYRLCALQEEGDFKGLTEECFQKTPLDFVEDEQSIVFPGQKSMFFIQEQIPKVPQ